jgi:hypothetical protein
MSVIEGSGMAVEHALDLPDGTRLRELYFPGAVQAGDRVRVDGSLYEVEHALAVIAGAQTVVRARLKPLPLVMGQEDG